MMTHPTKVANVFLPEAGLFENSNFTLKPSLDGVDVKSCGTSVFVREGAFRGWPCFMVIRGPCRSMMCRDGVELGYKSELQYSGKLCFR